MLILLLVTACAPIVPATTPPQLEHTPGAFVVVTDETFDTGEFAVEYPSSWRVVKTSVASAEYIQVVFVAPDKSTVTVTQVDSASEPSDDEQYITLENDTVLQVMLTPADDADDSFFAQAEHLIISIR